MQNRQVNELPATVTGADRAFLDLLVGRIQPDDRINALFLGGSHAGGTADRYSDLDLTLITTDTDWKSVLSERRQLLQSLGDIVFLEEHGEFGFLLLLFIYADGVRGELSLTPAHDVGSVVGGPNMTVFDKVGLLDGLEPIGLTNETRLGLVRRSLVWFWYERGLLDVFLARGSLWTAHFYLERCRERCLNLASLLDRPDVWPGGHEKARGALVIGNDRTVGPDGCSAGANGDVGGCKACYRCLHGSVTATGGADGSGVPHPAGRVGGGAAAPLNALPADWQNVLYATRACY